MTNFDVLFENDQIALVDLLRCYQPGHTCGGCAFSWYGRQFGLCGDGGDEWDTVSWLGGEPPVAVRESLHGELVRKAALYDQIANGGCDG